MSYRFLFVLLALLTLAVLLAISISTQEVSTIEEFVTVTPSPTVLPLTPTPTESTGSFASPPSYSLYGASDPDKNVDPKDARQGTKKSGNEEERDPDAERGPSPLDLRVTKPSSDAIRP